MGQKFHVWNFVTISRILFTSVVLQHGLIMFLGGRQGGSQPRPKTLKHLKLISPYRSYAKSTYTFAIWQIVDALKNVGLMGLKCHWWTFVSQGAIFDEVHITVETPTNSGQKVCTKPLHRSAVFNQEHLSGYPSAQIGFTGAKAARLCETRQALSSNDVLGGETGASHRAASQLLEAPESQKEGCIEVTAALRMPDLGCLVASLPCVGFTSPALSPGTGRWPRHGEQVQMRRHVIYCGVCGQDTEPRSFCPCSGVN